MDMPGVLAEQCLASKARLLQRIVVGAYDDALRDQGLTVAQLDLLAAILAAGNKVRPADLSDRLHMDPSTLSRNLSRLERRGWIAVAPTESRREHHVFVTSAGQTQVDRSDPPWRTAQEALRARIGPDGEAALALLVTRLSHPAAE